MKKLFFSAIALVAFSGVSFGNTIDVEEQIIALGRDCALEANQMIETIILEEGELDQWEEDYYWYQYYSGCLNEIRKK